MSSDIVHPSEESGLDAPPSGVREGGVYQRLLGKLEHAQVLDRYVDAAAPLAQRLVARESVRRLFHGDTTGIPAHDIIKDVPFGAWFMAQFLDLFPDPGSQRAATRLIALGLVSSGAAGLTGWAEWALRNRAARRVGVVHAASNGVAVLVFLASWVARVRGRHGLGVALARAGGGFLVIGGFLGGHLASGRPDYH